MTVTSALPWHTFAARLVVGLLAATALTGCAATERLSRIGQPPAMTPVSSPTQNKDYRPVSMPMPTPLVLEPAANSLWRPGARAFFKDQRAKLVGDVMTVVVNIQNENAQLQQQTSRTRSGSSESATITNFFGLGAIGSPNPAINATSDSNFDGKGAASRSETINTRLAAVVLQVLPNGNLAIAGRQEIRVNNDLRELKVAGVIRPEDIRSDNTIASDKIAEARISYGGRGIITDVQQPRYGQQIFDVIFPF